ncbi:hypothetical protein I3W98_10135 [Streptomyces cavourensis]|nr:hypothetical protein [Streptomyces cavourensis]
MYDLPPDLDRLHTLRTWHAMWLDRIDQAIQAAEQQEREARQAHERRAAAPPPPPSWMIGVHQLSNTPEEVHVGGCIMWAHRRRKTVTREEARRLLADGLRACQFCKPDAELGLLE